MPALGVDDAVIAKSYADDNEVGVGGKLKVQSASGDERTVDRPRDLRPAGDRPDARHRSRSPSRRSTRRSRSPRTGSRSSTPAPRPQAALEATAEPFNDAKLHTGDAFAKDYTKGFASFLNLLYVMLAFSVVVSLFGMVNTLVLSVFERTRELGMLRTIGMTRRQARRMIRHESVITALIGAALGLPLGIFLAALVTQALSQYDVGMSIPVADAGRVHAGRDPGRHRRGRSSPRAGPRGSTCSTRCTTNDRHRHDPRRSPHARRAGAAERGSPAGSARSWRAASRS